jgi:hypothetical protein
MMDMLRSVPVITPDVDRFMDEYLDNYRGGDSAAEVVRALRRLAGDASNA